VTVTTDGDIPLGDEEDVGYPAGANVDAFGRCKLVGDPDALMHDPVALDRAWRLVREEGLGQYGGFGDSPQGKERFAEAWKAALDQRVDLVDTLSVQRWRENETRARFEQRVAEESRQKVQAKTARKSAAFQQVMRDLEAYAEHVAEHEQRYAYLLGSGTIAPPAPPDFGTWQRQRIAEREHEKRFGTGKRG
jgi:hypothetical protein